LRVPLNASSTARSSSPREVELDRVISVSSINITWEQEKTRNKVKVNGSPAQTAAPARSRLHEHTQLRLYLCGYAVSGLL
jgi:hypothetical protein